MPETTWRKLHTKIARHDGSRGAYITGSASEVHNITVITPRTMYFLIFLYVWQSFYAAFKLPWT